MTSEEIGHRLAAFVASVEDVLQEAREDRATLKVLLSRVGDPELVTVREAVELEKHLYGERKASIHTVRARIKSAAYTVVRAPGEKEGKIAVREIIEVHRKGYAPATPSQRTAREAAERKGQRS